MDRVYRLFGATDFRNLVNILFKGKTNHGLVQFFRYGFVGGISAVADIGSLYAFTEFFNFHYLISAAMAFIIGTVVNYTLSVLWIFETSGKWRAEIGLFTLIGFGGLLLNELILWVLVDHVGVFYVVAKLISVSMVMFWSFGLRKLLFSKLHKQG